MSALRSTWAGLCTPDGRANRRLALVDTLRGLALVSMIAFHLCYNLDRIFGISVPWFHSTGAWIWQLFTSGPFLVLAGVCTHLSSRPLRHALRTGMAALSITLVTFLFMPEQLIVFGILHCMTWCQLIYAGTQRFLKRVTPWLGLAFCVMLYIVTFHVPQGSLLFGRAAIELPQGWYLSYWLSVLGFRSPTFYSADYFPLLPNLFLFLAGHYLGYGLPYLSRRVREWSIGPLAFLGRHSMTVYLLHQPVLFGLMTIFLG